MSLAKDWLINQGIFGVSVEEHLFRQRLAKPLDISQRLDKKEYPLLLSLAKDCIIYYIFSKVVSSKVWLINQRLAKEVYFYG